MSFSANPHPTPWKGWVSKEDIPFDLRKTIQEGAFIPLLNPDEASALRHTMLSVFSEVLDIYLEEKELQWRCQHVHLARPQLPMESVFAAISLEVGVSISRLKQVWYESRRKSRVKDLVLDQMRKEVTI
jgi:hypothetical protein